MNRAPSAITAHLRQLQRLHDYALTGECGIAVHQHRYYLIAVRVIAPLLTRAHRTFHHRIDDLEVRGIEGECHVDVAGGRSYVGGEALVILDVTGTLHVILIESSLELREQHGGRLAEDVDQHIESAAMRHAEHEFLDAGATALLQQVIEQRDQHIGAFEREALLADEFSVQVALDALRRGQLGEQVAALLGRKAVLHAAELKLILQPQPLVAIRDVREFRADVSTVDHLQAPDDLAQRRALRDPLVAAGGEEHGIQIGIAQTRIVQIQHARTRALLQPEWIDAGDQMAAIAVDLDQARYRGLLLAGGIGDRRAGRARRAALRTRGNSGDDAAVGAFRLAATGERIEVATPLGVDAARIGEILLIQRFHVRRIGAGERCAR